MQRLAGRHSQRIAELVKINNYDSRKVRSSFYGSIFLKQRVMYVISNCIWRGSLYQ